MKISFALRGDINLIYLRLTNYCFLIKIIAINILMVITGRVAEKIIRFFLQLCAMSSLFKCTISAWTCKHVSAVSWRSKSPGKSEIGVYLQGSFRLPGDEDDKIFKLTFYDSWKVLTTPWIALEFLHPFAFKKKIIVIA